MKKLYIYLSLAALVTGCQKNDLDNNLSQGHQLTVSSVALVTSDEWSTRSTAEQDSTVMWKDSTVVELGDSVTMTCHIGRIGEQEQVVTRGTPMNSANDISTFKINLYNTGANNWSAGGAVTSAITATKSGNSFMCSPSYNWKSKTDKVTLIGYTPTATSSDYSINGLKEINNGSKIQYIVPSENVANHPDFCVSTDMNIVNSNGTNHIRTFNMGHKLTAVGFAINGWNVKITAVRIEGVSFYANYNISTGAWEIVQTLGYRDGGVSGSTVSDAYNPDKRWTNATSNNGYMMMIPQTLGANAKATITYAATGGTATGGTITAPLSGMTSGKWEAGQKVTYNIQLKMAPVSSTTELVMDHKAGYTTSNALAFGTKDPNDEYTFTWSEDWLYVHHGAAKAGDVSGGATSGWKMPARNITSNIYFFSKTNNTSSSTRIATVTMTGKRTGTKTFTVKQKKLSYDNDYTDQPANCYITYPGKTLSFNATLKPRTKGGSVTSKTTCTDVRSSEGLNNDIPLSSIKRIEVSWQTAANHGTSGGAANMIIQKIEYDAATGVCTVTPHSSGTGNAVISAYDAASGGKILWNWHIWVTNGTVGNAGSANSVTFMDRNIGALAATAAKPTKSDAYKYFGVLYQNGRPTPFSGQGSGESSNVYTAIYNGAATKLSSGSIGGYTLSNTAVSSVTDAIKTPNTHYNATINVSGYWSESWYNFGDISLWSDYGTNKSIYDPCPYGYRVPKDGSYNGFTSTQWTENAIDGGAVWSNTWWPAAGSRSYTLEAVGRIGAYWSSTHNPSSSYYPYYSYCLALYNNYGAFPNTYSARSDTFSVRCVQE